MSLDRVVLMSDLHMEMRGYDHTVIGHIDADLVILAGDIGVGVEGVLWAQKAIKCPVLYIAGNHEFYHHEFSSLIEELRDAAKGSNVTILENDSVVIKGIRYLGCTLWTDFQLHGLMMKNVAMQSALDCMSDFYLIRGNRGMLTPQDTVFRHERSRVIIENQISASIEPVVVITHHAPSKATLQTRYALDPLSAAFHSELDSLMKPNVLCWIYGHTHNSGAWMVNGVPSLSNQWGYPRESNVQFDPKLTISAGIESCK